jgi:hypothetical protein
MTDFFDQNTGEFDDDTPMDDRPNGASVLVNGSYQRLEAGSNFLQSVKNVALQAGFGKFKVFLNGIEVRPSSAPVEVMNDHRVEIRPFDEAG